MKVLYISGMYPTPDYPQKGIFCHEQVKAMKQIGVDVDVVVPMTIYDKEYKQAIWEYEGVKIRYVRFFKLPGTRRFENIGKSLYRALKCLDLDFKQYDVFHADAPLPAGVATMLLSQCYHIPYIVHCHGLDVFFDVDYKKEKNCNKIVERAKETYLNASAITGVSKKTLENVNSRIEVLDKCYVVYNGADTDKFYPEQEKQNSKLEIVSIGNLIDLKGHDLTIHALKKNIELGRKQVHLTIYGRGSKEDELRELVEQLELETYVTFKGYVTYENIIKELKMYDVFILPSWYEALGCVYLEAMASGVITVGCYQNGIDEIIHNGNNGFLVRPHEVEDIVEVIKNIYDNKDTLEMKNIALAGRKTIMEKFTWKNSAEALRRVYYDIVQKNK